MASTKQEWSSITPEERIQHETLFYSQGPVDGYLTAEKARDVFLKSGLPLQVLSQIWNLADVSNDNLLNVHEFVLAMHLTLGTLQGLKLPLPLPRFLTPPTTENLKTPVSDTEKEAYSKIFQILDRTKSGFIDADMAREVLALSGLPPEILARIWNIADINRDGSLDPEEWMIACHLIRTVRKGQSIECPVNVFSLLPHRIAPNSLQARKKRVEEYEQKKQRLMAIKEKRKQEVTRETQRLKLFENSLNAERDLFHLLKKSGQSPVSVEEFTAHVAEETAEITRQEEIVFRLKKEHERIRQNTVKIILEEQKLADDIRILKKGTDELNKKLRAIHTKATKDPDPFHELYEQKKEKKVTLADLDTDEIYIPFTFNPFNPQETQHKVTSGELVFRNCDTENNNHRHSSEIPDKVKVSFKNIDDSFVDIWVHATKMSLPEEEDPVFKPMPVGSMGDNNWFSLHLAGDHLLGEDSRNFAALQQKLTDLKNEMQKLNTEGERLVFKNPDDYTARKRAKEEEEKVERQRHPRRGVDGKENIKRHSYTSKPDEATQAAREYRLKRRSLHIEGKSESSRESPSAVRKPLQTASSPQRAAVNKSLSSPVESQLSPEKSAKVEKLDLSSLESPKESHEKSLEQVKPQNTQDLHSPSPEKSPRVQSPEGTPRSSTKSPPRSSVKKTRAPQPPGFASSTTASPKSPTSLESPAEKQVQLVAKVKATPNKASKTHSKDNSKTTPKSPDLKSQLSPSSSKTSPQPQASSPNTGSPPVAPPRRKKRKDSERSITSEGSGPVNDLASPRSPEVSPSKFDPPSPRKNVVGESHLRNTDVDANSLATLKEVKAEAHSASPPKRLSDLGFEDSKSKPVILTDSLESEIFGALKTSQLFNGNDTFSNDSNTVQTQQVTTSTVTKESSPAHLESTVTITKGSDPSRTETVIKSGRREVVTQNSQTSRVPNGHDPDYSNAYGGARPKVREPVKKEQPKKESNELQTTKKNIQSQESPRKEPQKEFKRQEAVRTELPEELVRHDSPKKQQSKQETVKKESKVQESTRTESHSAKKQNQTSKPDKEISRGNVVKIEEISPAEASQYQAEEEEEIETIIEEVIEIRTALDASGNPVIDTSNPEYKSEVISTKKTVISQPVEHTIVLEARKPQESQRPSVKSPKRRAPAPPAQKAGFPHGQSQSKTSKIEASPSTTPPSVRVKDVSKRSSIPDHLSGGAAAGYDSDASDASSVAPPLPESAPPPLPSSVPPPSGQVSREEIVEIEFKSPVSAKSSTSGDSGILVSSLPTSPDEADHGIQLVSYSGKKTRGDNSGQRDSSFIHSSVDSAFEDSTLSPSSSFDSTKGSNLVKIKTEQTYSRHDGPRSPELITSPRGKVYDSQEIVDKARQFAEIVQKPNFVVKRETSGDDDFNQERLQELEMERRAVISQATVKRKFSPGVSSPTEESPPSFFEESVEEQPGSKQHWELLDQNVPTPEAGWTGKPDKVSLYSENVIQEAETTDEVNRESISNLLTTRQQWETKFTPDKTDTLKKSASSTVRHWEVDFPNKRKSVTIDVEREDISSSDKMSDSEVNSTESAIEREIRLNMEREESLRKEQEERKKVMEIHKGKVDTTIYESVPNEDSKPMFHELTEADRGSELKKRETIIQQELREQEEKEKALRKKHERQLNRFQEPKNNGNVDETTESIIEREIRVQREREAELLRQRNLKSSQAQQQVEVPEPEPAPEPVAEPHNDINHNQTKDISYEAAIANHTHEGESRIARELREAREREEELHRQREKLNQITISVTPSKSETVQQSQQQTPPSAKSTPKVTNISWQKDVSPFLQKSKRSGSIDSLASSHSTGRTPSDFGTPTQDDDDFKEYKPKPETPIEREIRLARERENELRRAKGLPEIPDPKAERSGPTHINTSSDTPRHMRSATDNSSAMKRYSSSRLQQEIIKQKQRELDLRKEGKIITTSEERIEPMKYVSVTGQETANVGVKRNFVTRKSSGPYTPPVHDDIDGSDTVTPPSGKTSLKTDTLKSRKVSSAGGAGFSYKESRNTAESKIERELREMREREDELKKQRTHKEDEPSSQGEATANGEVPEEPVANKKGNLAAQWEQVCNN